MRPDTLVRMRCGSSRCCKLLVAAAVCLSVCDLFAQQLQAEDASTKLSSSPGAPPPAADARIARTTKPPITTRVRQHDGVPIFAWDAVPQASEYALVVYQTDTRRLIWVWTGAATEVRYGSPPDEFAGRPVRPALLNHLKLADELHWRVIAVAADGRPVAVSVPHKLR